MAFKYKKEAISIITMLAALAIVFSSLFIYTGNWPPAVIVESSSMQHGNNFVFGVINTGDIVAVKKVTSFTEVQTYLLARERGFPSNYGEFGNVIVYKNYLLRELVIHRAIFYVEGWAGTTPILYGNNNPSWLLIQGSNVYITDVGYTHQNLEVKLQNVIGQEGFVTMGDNNFANRIGGVDGNYTIAADQDTGIDYGSLVNATQVVGYAVGYLPVFGVLKLWITGQTEYIPQASNEIMVILIIVIIALIFVPIPSFRSKKSSDKEKS